MKVSHPHPLYAAQVRVDRAGQLIGTLRRQFQRWTDAQTEVVEAGTFTQVGPTEFSVSLGNDRPIHHLVRAAVTVGEIAYNCRAALDYLVRELATVNNKGREVRGTQFPIEDDEAWFWARVTGKHPTEPGRKVARYLKKVPPDAVGHFRELQPFAGCEWTELLRDVSNPDKHRSIPFITSHEDFRGTVYNPVSATITGRLYVRITFDHAPKINVVGGLRFIHSNTKELIESYCSRIDLSIRP